MHDDNYSGAAPGLAAPERLSHSDHPGLAPLGAAGSPHAGLSPPGNEDATELGSDGGTGGQRTTDRRDCEAGPPAAQVAAETIKRCATLAAHLALKGFELHQTPAGTYIVTRWNLARDLPDLAAVHGFADQVGAGS